ncbi:hypothetical protein TRM7557_03435 [Tritonibacter multivorans]|uniref:Secreted protein n=1 Tax=Tritonibacter multivorans TaxID=928856 RepID=A0A0P1GHK7_9RHOB|nr:hypothetical protein [Tritonibacter multivorans]MDA7420508.1 hypothetical protein [Tritonibacter multivorans]CUH81460.1 hypothetical protein TRM7557_03435 [Tritonibacter multivorans]SFC35895.1 hypothetical protein SAMN04488049_102271 [Tritonibacter multivorans]
MKTFTKAAGSLLLIGSLGLASAAQAGQTLTCDFSDPGRNHVIPAKVVVTFADDGTTAMVEDRMILREKRKPIEAKFVKLTSKLYRVRWELLDVEGSGGALADLEYRLYYKPKKGKAHLDFSARGYPNTDRGNGTCDLK